MNKHYRSPSTGQECTAAQFIAEVLCVRNFKRQNSNQDPGYKFWNKDNKRYQTEIISVSKLMNMFDENIIVSYLLGPGKNIYSSGYYTPHKWLVESLKKYSKQKQSKPIIIEQVDIDNEIEEMEKIIIPKVIKKKTLFEKLNG